MVNFFCLICVAIPIKPVYYLCGCHNCFYSFIFTTKKLHVMRKLLIAFLILPIIAIAQKKQITLEDIYKNRTFQGSMVPGFSEQPLDSIINTNDVKDETGKQLNTRDYQLSDDKKR